MAIFFLHTLWQCHVCIHNEMVLILMHAFFYLRIKRVKNWAWNEKKKNEINLLMYNTLILPYKIRFLKEVCWNELEFLYSFKAFYISCLGQISSPSHGKSMIPPYVLTNGLVCLLPHSPKSWNFWQKKRSVKTGYLYFYWFLQTMTTFPERQCQETINVCEKEVQVLMSINCLVPQETAAWRNHWS